MAAKQKKKSIGVPEPTVRRLPLYLHYLKELQQDGKPHISAPHIARAMKYDATKVVKDLSYTGIVGKTRVGYNVLELISVLEDFLGFNRKNEAFLIGAGRLGSALIGYPRFNEYGFKIIAAFDISPEKIGTEINGVKILNINKFRGLAERLHISLGIITTPAEVAQQMADLMIGWGIKAIWNFTPVNIKVPENILLQHTSIYSNLAVLLNKLHLKSKIEEENFKNSLED